MCSNFKLEKAEIKRCTKLCFNGRAYWYFVVRVLLGLMMITGVHTMPVGFIIGCMRHMLGDAWWNLW